MNFICGAGYHNEMHFKKMIGCHVENRIKKARVMSTEIARRLVRDDSCLDKGGGEKTKRSRQVLKTGG